MSSGLRVPAVARNSRNRLSPYSSPAGFGRLDQAVGIEDEHVSRADVGAGLLVARRGKKPEHRAAGVEAR